MPRRSGRALVAALALCATACHFDTHGLAVTDESTPGSRDAPKGADANSKGERRNDAPRSGDRPRPDAFRHEAPLTDSLAPDSLLCGSTACGLPRGDSCFGSFCQCNGGPGCTGFLSSTCCPGAGCIDTTSDVNNCGTCGHACLAGEGCCSGKCLPLDSPAHCGLCGIKCLAGWGCCGGICTDIAMDTSNCGTCGTLCAGTLPACCSGTCADLSSDNAHCGTCAGTCTGAPSNQCKCGFCR